MRIWLSGGTGFVGGAVTRALVGAGHEVTWLCHVAHPAPPAGVRVVEGDVRSEGAWADSLRGHDAVVHLVAIIREWVAKGVTFEALNVGATHRVLTAAHRAGVRRFVHMSALGVGRSGKARYMQTKARAETEVLGSGLDVTVLRPSLVFGQGAPFFALMTRLARLPVTPVIGPGNVPFQPVALDDVARAVVRALERDVSVGRVYEMGGPDVVTYRELLDHLRGGPVRAIHLPMGLMRTLAGALEASPAFPLTVDQLAMLSEPGVAQDRRWEEDLGLQAASFVAWARDRADRPV